MDSSTNIELFKEQEDGLIKLIYPPDNGMNAKEIGEAILGMQVCLSEAAKIAKIGEFEIIIFPTKKGSFVTDFAFVAEGVGIVVGIRYTIALINDVFELMRNIGVSKAHSPDNSILERVSKKEVLELCKSMSFIYGAQQVVSPLKEKVETLEIRYMEKETIIKYESKKKFFEPLEQEIILSDLVNGKVVRIAGEIERINKKSNDIGFRYKGKSLQCTLTEGKESVAQFHGFMEDKQVMLIGKVVRESDFETPRIIITSIEKIEDPQKSLPVEE